MQGVQAPRTHCWPLSGPGSQSQPITAVIVMLVLLLLMLVIFAVMLVIGSMNCGIVPV